MFISSFLKVERRLDFDRSTRRGKTVDPLDPLTLPFADSPEDFKTKVVQRWVRDGRITEAAADVWRLGGLSDYVNKRKRAAGTNVAPAADAMIKAKFPDAENGVHADWTLFQNGVEAAFKKAVQAHKEELIANQKAEEESVLNFDMV
jgi:hypothetical protein